MNELYYSTKCKSLFWITSNSNPIFVPAEMSEVKAAFHKRTDVPVIDQPVQVRLLPEASRFGSVWVMYVGDYEMPKNEAFLVNDWTMDEWLSVRGDEFGQRE